MFNFFSQKYFFIIILTVVLLSVKIEQGNAGEIDQVLQDTLAVTHPDSLVPIMIYLSAQVDLDALENAMKQTYGEPIPFTSRYQTVLTALQSTASQTQPELLNRINEFEQGTVENITALWIRNIML
jgi:hypothetical protein